MEVPDEGNRFFSDYANEMFYFCSPECKRKFDDHPDDYIREHARNELGI
jgi:YHS domain-containing protein